MPEAPCGPEPEGAALRAEIVRLEKIIRALMDRAERSTEVQGSDFSLFQTAVMLEHEVQARTAELESALRENEQVYRALRRSEEKFAAIFSLAPDPMALTRLADGVLLDVSHSAPAYFGYQRAELIGHSSLPGDLGLWLEARHRERWRAELERGGEGEALAFEAPLRRKDGSTRVSLISAKRVEIGDERCAVVAFRDITEQKRHAERLERIAHHDPLTGLPNRALLGERLREAIERDRQAGACSAVCYLDLDGFKAVNDRFGHPAGDRVLVEIAGRLEASVRAGDTVARLGGDEFVVLLGEVADDAGLGRTLVRLLQAVAEPFQLGEGPPLALSASLGVSRSPRDGDDPDTLLLRADQAMYVAKQSGKSRYRLFEAPDAVASGPGSAEATGSPSARRAP
jgi:diguanylate cyclase (GGDEF)-like protein/PAS domain S-box-containing protein